MAIFRNRKYANFAVLGEIPSGAKAELMTDESLNEISDNEKNRNRDSEQSFQFNDAKLREVDLKKANIYNDILSNFIKKDNSSS